MYILDDPKDRLRDVYWNFEYEPENIVPEDWGWINENANEEAVLCGDGTQDKCTGWFYRARYGQYYILIHFYRDIHYEVFEEIVKSITNQFVRNLE